MYNYVTCIKKYKISTLIYKLIPHFYKFPYFVIKVFGLTEEPSFLFEN